MNRIAQRAGGSTGRSRVLEVARWEAVGLFRSAGRPAVWISALLVATLVLQRPRFSSFDDAVRPTLESLGVAMAFALPLAWLIQNARDRDRHVRVRSPAIVALCRGLAILTVSAAVHLSAAITGMLTDFVTAQRIHPLPWLAWCAASSVLVTPFALLAPSLVPATRSVPRVALLWTLVCVCSLGVLGGPGFPIPLNTMAGDLDRADASIFTLATLGSICVSIAQSPSVTTADFKRE